VPGVPRAQAESLPAGPLAEDASCEIFTHDAEKVARLKPLVGITQGMAPLFKALADDTRVKIVYALTQEDELCVCDVASIIGSSVATASHHLRLLRLMRLVRSRREGKMMFYSLHDEHVRQLMEIALAHVQEENGALT